MRKFALLVLAVVFGWSSGVAAAPIEWTVASGGNGHSYEVVDNGMNWTSAKAYAESQGGYLATIRYEAEQDFILDFVVPDPPLGWGGALKLGGYQDTSAPDYSEPGGGWRWVTGEPWSYTNWSPVEPNDHGGAENFLTLHHVPANGNEYTWNDNSAGYGFPFIIEYGTPGEPVPEPSTALLLGVGLAGLGMKRRRARSHPGGYGHRGGAQGRQVAVGRGRPALESRLRCVSVWPVDD